MKLIKTLSVVICALAILAGPAIAADAAKDKDSKDKKLPACCEKAKAEGKECTHKCCVEAKKEGKTCEKCGKKGDKKGDKATEKKAE
jgi:hypothetical protein